MKLRSVEEINKDVTEAAVEESIFLRIIEFGLKHPDGFTYSKIMKDLKLEGWEKATVGRYIHSAGQNAYNTELKGESSNLETPFFVVKLGDSNYFEHDSYTYVISFDAHFKYVDYQELKFARENAREAKRLSIRAIWLSAIAVVVSAAVPFLIAEFVTQTVKIVE